jgi:hypothetical protein
MALNEQEGRDVTPILDGRAWVGTGTYYGTEFLVELFESQKHPGYYHYATHCADDRFCGESSKPIKADFLEGSLDLILKEHNLVSAELDWQEVAPADLPLLGERVRDGD